VNWPSLSWSKYSSVNVFEANVAFEIVPGGAFSPRGVNVKMSPSQWVNGNDSPRGPMDSCNAPLASVIFAGPQ